MGDKEMTRSIHFLERATLDQAKDTGMALALVCLLLH